MRPTPSGAPSGERMRTMSSRSKSPSTAVTPTARMLAALLCETAAAAPASRCRAPLAKPSLLAIHFLTPEAGRGAASKRVHTTSRSVRIRSVRILSRRPLAITTSMPSPAARDEMRLLVVMPPRPREERAVSMYCERSRPGATRRMTCEAGSEGEPS